MNREIDFKFVKFAFKKRRNDFLNRLFYITFLFYISYKLLLITYPAKTVFIYRLGQIISDISIGYVVSYIFYFLSVVIPFEAKAFNVYPILRKRSELFYKNIDLLLTNMSGDKDWLKHDKEVCFANIQKNSRSTKVIEKEHLFSTDIEGNLRYKLPLLEHYYFLVVKVEEALKDIESFQEYIYEREIVNLSYELRSSDFHKFIKGLYLNITAKEFVENEYSEALMYKLYGTKLLHGDDNEDYIGNVKKLISKLNDAYEFRTSPNTPVH